MPLAEKDGAKRVNDHIFSVPDRPTLISLLLLSKRRSNHARRHKIDSGEREMSNLILCTPLSITLALTFAYSTFGQGTQTSPSHQELTVARLAFNEAPPVRVNEAQVIDGLLRAEAKVREQLNHHTFRRDVLVQTLGPMGEVTGEYRRNSQFVFDDSGKRIERVLYRPPSTLKAIKISKEDIQDLAGAQLLGIDVTEASKYRLQYVGVENLNGRETLAIDLTPARKPNPHRMRERFFVGRVWIDPISFQILKVKGVVEPGGKQRFPIFETWRERIDTVHLFPSRTEADQLLHFPHVDVQCRIKVRYYDYKRFASQLTITEIAETPAP